MRAIVMKPLLLPLLLLVLLTSLASAQREVVPSSEVTSTFQMWCRAKVPALELKNSSFEFAYGKLAEEWLHQSAHKFPFSLDDFGPSESTADGMAASITMSLKDVPFREAVEMLCAASGKQINPRAGLFHLEPGDPVLADDWSAKVYILPPRVLDLLDFGPDPNGARLADVYAKLGLRFDWGVLHLDGDKLCVLASNENHHRIKWLHELLERGYTISRFK
jgi:hypothetical protein